ncbi:MAG: hypothetical protein A2498_00905 [Lentisphaerae bacterium RIFOXYC12_FULL_60_16]|nr:MAG: hypothetical protein A2498_00905 [Lentisphaerae bacterium RIFOXYC12_FULL_60_16]
MHFCADHLDQTVSDANGLRRTNADKRRCVEIALKEWPKLSSRAVAELCGVAPNTVEAARPAGAQIEHLNRTGTDGKQYPPTRKRAESETTKQEEREPERKPAVD